jgi:ABC-type nitrate/sulfonate/bicarbonate transport system substrate-binding protein
MSPTSLVVNVFAGAGNLPLMVAEEREYFARNGLAVELVPTANSADQLRGLIEGRWPIVHTSPDNLLAWGERANVELVAWLGARNGPLSLVARPPIRSVAELRGRALAVDALDTGYAFVLRAILAAHGLAEGDYRLEPLGATNLRWQALREGRTPATLLSAPFTLLARDLCCALLATHEEVLPGLLTMSAGSRRDWLTANAEVAAAYARAYAAGVTWCYDPANRAAACDLLVGRFALQPAIADEMLSTLLDPRIGLIPAGHLDLAGLEKAVELRASATGWRPSALSAYYDFGPYRRAQGAVD